MEPGKKIWILEISLNSEFTCWEIRQYLKTCLGQEKHAHYLLPIPLFANHGCMYAGWTLSLHLLAASCSLPDVIYICHYLEISWCSKESEMLPQGWWEGWKLGSRSFYFALHPPSCFDDTFFFLFLNANGIHKRYLLYILMNLASSILKNSLSSPFRLSSYRISGLL